MNNKKSKISNKVLISILIRLEMYLSSGLSLDQSLDLICQNTSKYDKKIILQIKSDILNGLSLAKSFEMRLTVKNNIITLIENGEATGRLKESLVFCYKLLEKESEFFKKIISALTYPLIIASFSLTLTAIMIQSVLKQIIPLLRSLKVSLPVSTRIIIYISQLVSKSGLWILLSLITIVLAIFFLHTKNSKAKFYSHFIFLHIPILGSFIAKYLLYILFRSYSSLIQSGLVHDLAYKKVVSQCTILPIKKYLQNNIQNIDNGKQISKVFDYKYFPSYVSPLINAGEISGTLAFAMFRLSEIIERELDDFIKKFTILVEPVMMILVGLIVGFVAISIIVPIYNISNSLQHA